MSRVSAKPGPGRSRKVSPAWQRPASSTATAKPSDMRIELTPGPPAELARPDGDARRGLVIACDIGGLRPLFDDMAARLAHENDWAVIAVEPFPGRESMELPDRLKAVG